jgi:3-deoxy-manno-octulosonate cytidylyltransferase (CMP-KDO synthetase)
MKVVTLDPSPLEKKERLEQLRVLENGYRIKLISTDYDAPGVDTPADLKQVRERIAQLEDN